MAKSTLATYVDSAVANQLENIARDRGMTVSAAIKAAIHAWLDAQGDPDDQRPGWVKRLSPTTEDPDEECYG
jgi:post-segregation antitoxin (ccd killing protein)